MIQAQINTLQSGLAVGASLSSTGIKVSGVGPRTVAVQVSVTAQSSANFTAQLEGSLDGTSYFLIDSPQTIAANGEFGFKDTAVAYAWYRVRFVRTGGSFTAAVRTFVYGETA